MSGLKARPTTYRGVEMRSRLEARFAAMLDDLDMAWEYEPRAFADGHAQYLPDFRLTSPGGGTNYVEVKGDLDPGSLWDTLQRMEIIHASEPHAGLIMFIEAWDSMFMRGPDPDEWQVKHTNLGDDYAYDRRPA